MDSTMRAGIAPGGIFPDYELTDHTTTRRRLSELQGIDPTTSSIQEYTDPHHRPDEK
jgi:hypothetical protein